MNKQQYTQQKREQAAIRMFDNAHQGSGEAHGFLWLSVNQAIVECLQRNGFSDSMGGYDYITKGLVSMAARIALDMAKEKYTPNQEPQS